MREPSLALRLARLELKATHPHETLLEILRHIGNEVEKRSERHAATQRQLPPEKPRSDFQDPRSFCAFTISHPWYSSNSPDRPAHPFGPSVVVRFSVATRRLPKMASLIEAFRRLYESYSPSLKPSGVGSFWRFFDHSTSGKKNEKHEFVFAFQPVHPTAGGRVANGASTAEAQNLLAHTLATYLKKNLQSLNYFNVHIQSVPEDQWVPPKKPKA
ncbi:MAG TPA: hypothetical protein VI874_03965 [Candidatus Norongarragalinales archaeon]|nr:hypothetical protein [Candidatus Norongarragalinales archaeon]